MGQQRLGFPAGAQEVFRSFYEPVLFRSQLPLTAQIAGLAEFEMNRGTELGVGLVAAQSPLEPRDG